MSGIIKEIAFISLLHDIQHIIKSANLERDIPYHKWFSKTSAIDFVLSNHIQETLNHTKINDNRALAEIISHAENLSVGKIISNKGELSPLKSFFSLIKPKTETRGESFFHASEMSDDMLLDTERSKKGVYFDPSYLVSSFLDELNIVLNCSKEPLINSVYYLTRKYFWTVALSHHGDDFCYSVYDHSKMTCAIACSLFYYIHETNKTILISQNINYIREKLADPIEPRFALFKINIIPENNSDKEKLISKSVLLLASRRVLELFGLNDSSIFYINNSYSLVFTPNLNIEEVYKLIESLNINLLKQYDKRILLSLNHTAVRQNDIFPHYSKQGNFANFLWNELLPKTSFEPSFSKKYIIDEFDNFFGARKEQHQHNVIETEDTSQQQPDDRINDDNNISSDKEINLFIKEILPVDEPQSLFKVLNKEQTSKISHKGTNYLFASSGDFIRKPLLYENVDLGFINDDYNSDSKDNAYPLIKLELFIKNPAVHTTIYPNLSLLNSYLSITETIFQHIIKKAVDKTERAKLCYRANNRACFYFNPFYFYDLISGIHKETEKLFEKTEALVKHARILTDNRSPINIPKFDTGKHENLFFLYDKALSWDKALEFFEKADYLINNYINLTNDIEKHNFIRLLSSVKDNRFNLIFFEEESKLKNELMNFFDPQMLSKWLLYSITKEC